MSVWLTPYPEARRRPAISQFPFFLAVRLWLSYTRQSAMIRKSLILETRFILSPEARAYSLMACSATPWRPVHFYSFPPVKSTALRTSPPTSSFGWHFTDRKEANRMPKDAEGNSRHRRLYECRE